MTDNAKKYLSWLITASICMFLLIMIITAKWFPDKTAYDCIGYTVTVITLLTVVYVKWLWRFNPLEKTPKLKKKYTGVLISNYDKQRRKMELTIKQSLLSIRVYITTEESESKSIISDIQDDCDQMWLTYGYLNIPNAVVRDRSEIHYGMCRLLVDDVKLLKGQYFTDRKTLGDIELNAIEK